MVSVLYYTALPEQPVILCVPLSCMARAPFNTPPLFILLNPVLRVSKVPVYFPFQKLASTSLKENKRGKLPTQLNYRRIYGIIIGFTLE